jgi:hypothetical protein
MGYCTQYINSMIGNCTLCIHRLRARATN